jgi:TolB protein
MQRSTVATVVAVVLMLTVAALCATAGAAQGYPYAVEKPLATGDSAQSAAQVAAGIEAWQDDAAGDWDVWVGWRPSWAAIVAGLSAQRNPAVSGTRVVYEDDRSGGWDIYAWDAARPGIPAAEVAVAAGPGDQLDPAISGDVVVYEDYARGNADVAVTDLSTGTTRLLSTHASAQLDPATDGRWVVWADMRSGDWDVYAYDLQRRVLKRITTSKASQQTPQVGQGRVVFQDRRHGNWDVYEYSLSSGKERRLTSSASDQTAPQIDPEPKGSRSGNVVYVDDARDAGDLWVREGRTGIAKPFCSAPGAQVAPSLAAERAVWTDSRAGQPDVYSCDLAFPSLSAPSGTLTCSYGGTVKVSGRLYTYGSDGQKVRVAGYGATRTATVRSGHEDWGSYSLALPRVTKKLARRVWYAGDTGHLPAWGGTFVVKPRAALTRPSLARTPGKPTNGAVISAPSRCTISGTLRPLHPAGSRAVTVRVFRKTKYTDWKLYKTLRLKVTNSGTVSAYRTQVDLTSYLNWRVQAVHQDAGHALTESAFSKTLEGAR